MTISDHFQCEPQQALRMDERRGLELGASMVPGVL